MRVLIIGGGGQLGRELTKLTWPDGLTAHAPDRTELDLADPVRIARATAGGDIALVVNAAAYTNVDGAEAHPDAARRINATGPGVLAEATAAKGIPLVHVSTDYVFSGETAVPYVEHDAVDPINVYGATKLEGEEAVRAANPRHVILRTAWVFSPHRSNFVKSMLRLAGEREELRVVDDQRGNPTSAADLASAVATVAAHLLAEPSPPDGRYFGTYHFVNGGETTRFALAEHVLATSAALGGPHAKVIPVPTSEYPTPARRPRDTRLSTALLERTFRIRPRPWQPAVDDVVRVLVGEGTGSGK